MHYYNIISYMQILYYKFKATSSAGIKAHHKKQLWKQEPSSL